MLHLDVVFNKEADMNDLLDATSWAVMEFADAALGDLRRTQRLVHYSLSLSG